MPELTQRMIDAGATFFDSNGIPTRPDGTPALEENRPVEGIIAAISRGSDPANTENPLGYNFGPGYTPSAQDYPENRTPLSVPIYNLGMGEPPAEQYLDYSHGDPFPANWQDFKSGDRSTGGGFFTAEDLFANQVPEVFQSGSSFPSTNNWRLIPAGQPGFIMRNGQIINTNDQQGLYGPYGMGEFGGRYENPRWRGGSGLRVPAAHAFGSIAGSIFGWPGQTGTIGWINPAN